MTIDPADGPFTKARLIEIARYYYPAMENADLTATSSAELARIESATPQWQARAAAHEKAMAANGPWRELVRELTRELPDYQVADRSPRYQVQPAYVVHLVPLDRSREGMLVGMISGMAPLYFIGQSAGERTLVRPTDSAFAAAAQALERAIRARYPYHRLDDETGLTVVPELRAGDIWYRQATLIDLLFATNW